MAQFGAVAKLGTAIFSGFHALRQSRKRAPAARPVPPLPDENALSLEARRKRARIALRGGRVSTILDEETLG